MCDGDPPFHWTNEPDGDTPSADETAEQQRLRGRDEAEERRHGDHIAAEERRRLLQDPAISSWASCRQSTPCAT